VFWYGELGGHDSLSLKNKGNLFERIKLWGLATSVLNQAIFRTMLAVTLQERDEFIFQTEGNMRSECTVYEHKGMSLVTTAWCVLRLLMEGRPPDTEGSCKYIE
jgi:hypothetical protein